MMISAIPPGEPDRLAVRYFDRVTQGSGPTVKHSTIETILSDASDFELRVAGNPMSAVASGMAALVSPLFFQNSQHTFFIEPTVTDDHAQSTTVTGRSRRCRCRRSSTPSSYWERLLAVRPGREAPTPNRSIRSPPWPGTRSNPARTGPPSPGRRSSTTGPSLSAGQRSIPRCVACHQQKAIGWQVAAVDPASRADAAGKEEPPC